MTRSVVFLTSVFDHVETGPGAYAQYLWAAFKSDRDIDFHIVSSDIKTKTHENLHPVSVRSGARSIDVDRHLAKSCQNLLRRLGQDTIVHANAAHQAAFVEAGRRNLIVQINDYEVSKGLFDWKMLCDRKITRTLNLVWRNIHERRAVDMANCVICNSEFTRSAVLSAYKPSEPSKIKTIYKSVDLDFFDPSRSRRKDGFDPKSPRLLFIGTNWRLKGLKYLIEAIGLLKPRYPGLTLGIAGPSREIELGSLRRIAQRHRCEDRVRFLGHLTRAELREALVQSDIMVHPSTCEALGVSLLEAMCLGTPVIASAVGGIPEIVHHEDTGLLVRPRDAEEIAESIIRFLRSEALRSQCILKGQSLANGFSASKMVRAVKACYLH